MKIHDPNGYGTGIHGPGGPSGADAVGRGTSARGSRQTGLRNDQVEISNLAGHLSALTSDSPERLSRIEKLSADFQARRYQVDAAVISCAMVEDGLGARS